MGKIKGLGFVVAFLLVCFSVQVTGQSVQEAIEVALNSINLVVDGVASGNKDSNYTLDNGDQVPLSIVYKGTTYLPIRKVSELLGLDIGWDGNNGTISLTTSGEKSVAVEPSSRVVTIDQIRFDQLDLELSSDSVEAVALYYDHQYHDAKYKIEKGQLTISNKLPMGASAKVTVYTDEETVHYNIKKTTLPTLDDAVQSPNADMNYVLLPANPDEGFHFPMVLCVGNGRGIQASTDKKHLFVDTLNVGSSFDKEGFDNLDINDAIGSAGFGHMFATQLDMPFLLPLIPRVGASFSTPEIGSVYTYEAALDRDTIFYEEILSGEMYGQTVANDLKEQLVDKGFDPETFINIDEQVIEMIAFANNYLEDHGYVMEDKVFMNGFSASGTFVDRFATLHPEVVRAYCGGAAADDFVLPIDQVQGYELIMPLGVSDYATATGREFDLTAYNNVARIIHMGKDDTNDVMKYSDCYGDDERSIAYALWGKEPLDRAYAMFDDFEATGGKGLLVLDKGIKHGSSGEMNDYLYDFYKANVGDDTPVVYPEVVSSIMEYRLFD